jgi:lipid II isoglutaminyl synthase (glutamine-hydrolysing)
VIRLALIWLGKLLIAVTRLRGGGGSALPGLVVERIRPRLLAEQLAQLPGGVVIVTGTNGKTTTVKMLVAMLEHAGRRVVTNRSGSNMVRGLLSAVVEQSTWGGRLVGDVAVLEVDEPNVPIVARLVPADVLVVLNLHRDQLDRYGELERTATLIGDAVPLVTTVVANADDPLVAALADPAVAEGRVRWFGTAEVLRDQLPDDANLLVGAPAGAPAVVADELAVCLLDAVAGTALGHQDVTLALATGQVLPADLPLTGVFNASNLAAATAAVIALGVDAGVAVGGLAGLTPAFGRGERIDVGDRSLVLQLVKNPSSFTQVIHTQLVHGPPRVLAVAINDEFADGRDVSWLWDVDIEALAGRHDTVLVGGTRATDMALRFKYADIDCEVITDLEALLDRTLHLVGPDGVGVLVPTYTAMLGLRARLGRRTELAGFWQ